MSYGAELLEDMAVDYYCALSDNMPYTPRPMRFDVWVMRDGTRIKVVDMERSHIENCITMLKRGRETRLIKRWIKRFEEELERR